MQGFLSQEMFGAFCCVWMITDKRKQAIKKQRHHTHLVIIALSVNVHFIHAPHVPPCIIKAAITSISFSLNGSTKM